MLRLIAAATSLSYLMFEFSRSKEDEMAIRMAPGFHRRLVSEASPTRETEFANTGEAATNKKVVKISFLRASNPGNLIVLDKTFDVLTTYLFEVGKCHDD